MFGRRTQDPPPPGADPERRALFEALAQRPDTVCPFLGLDAARAEFHPEPTPQHRCFALGEPIALSTDQQARVCLQRGYGNCPRYLRGVLVIPTEELEALRRPLPPAAPPLAPGAGRAGAGGGRRGLLLVGLLLVVAAAGAAGYVAFAGPAPAATPALSVPPSPTESGAPSDTPEPTPTSPETPVPAPTPRPGDVLVGLEVTVLPGDYVIVLVDDRGVKVEERVATFSDFSRAGVEEITAPNGRHHWRTTDGEYEGWSYIKGTSGPFSIREVWMGEDGVTTYVILPDELL